MNPLEMLRLDLDIVHEQQLLSAAAVKRSKQLRIVGLHLDAKKEITDVSDAKRRLLKTFLISDVRNNNQVACILEQYQTIRKKFCRLSWYCI